MIGRARRALVLVAPALLLSGVLGTSAAAAATQRFASSTGMGAACSQMIPCDLTTAIQSAASGDEVIVTSGVVPYSMSAPIVDTVPLTIHGVPGLPAPVINSADPLDFTALKINNAQTTIRLLDLRETSPGGGALIFNGLLADQIIARGGGTGNGVCDIGLGTLRDSTCVATDSNGTGVLVGNGGTPVTLRNVTAIDNNATGGSGLTTIGQSALLVVTASNVIAHGFTDITVKGLNPGGKSKLNIDHSNYVTTSVDTANGSSLADAGGHQTTAPAFVNAAGFDYRQAPGSATIGTGADALANGPLDVDSDLRQIGVTDIGADEFAPAPLVTGTKATVTGSTGTIVSASVNPNGANATYQVNYGLTAGLGSTAGPFVLGATTTPQFISVPLNGLTFGTGYHYVVSVTTHSGTVTTPDLTFTTTGASTQQPSAPKSVTVPPPPPTPPAAPSIRALSLSPSRFAASGHSKNVHHGTSLHVTLSAAASVRFTVDAQTTGRIVGTHCQKVTSANRRRAKCDRSKTVGSFTHALATGATKTAFSGKVAGKSLPVGSYTLTAVATANAKHSASRLAKFTVVKG